MQLDGGPDGAFVPACSLFRRIGGWSLGMKNAEATTTSCSRLRRLGTEVDNVNSLGHGTRGGSPAKRTDLGCLERRETKGGRFNYRGRSIFGKVLEAGEWKWAPSPFPKTDPGRLTRHSRFWAAQGISEERYPQLMARTNGDLLLFWLGGGACQAFLSLVAFGGRVAGQSLAQSFTTSRRTLRFSSRPRARELNCAVLAKDPTKHRWPIRWRWCWTTRAGALDALRGAKAEAHHGRSGTGRFCSAQRAMARTSIVTRWNLDEREIRFPKVVDDLRPSPSFNGLSLP